MSTEKCLFCIEISFNIVFLILNCKGRRFYWPVRKKLCSLEWVMQEYIKTKKPALLAFHSK
ncbi:hypothetical protein PALI_b0742 [Pseudoalteromonas aliena SW19]|uniref:Uncharacterized protein n=1 Tax=Pseudoalteromonas aliena SW19 TaxID=1314866 RepID=A0ABR9E533_9GAMM|nr:hypothetical protein [Pseudoalteromonas aliena SW19]